ncbi:hypothetical protein TCAL_04723 [Tigriopus californicus]|uniref:Uncharacterized protein n=1 Tax=Tigriopus californicus TaxID=6832 RepID=A0A553PTF1_TIGCA|nr:uncharacterized protein LOC131892259 [Tigriopus californicus]TRY80944.1 hypothetical protein TCAL_04723 [Tigriopus californicus]|eukprot:TCALIF_04723-PA protein Name:"Protein of unknown function" AED:0.34 eAED:0.34 QI:46/1/1/1/1/1/4/81/171
MKSFSLTCFVLASVALASALKVPKDALHAECSVTWTVNEACESSQEKIIDQINAWDNEDCGTQPGDTEPNGQKCLYKYGGSDGLYTYGTHTTPIARYVDDIDFTFIPQSDGSCQIDGHSKSQTLSLLDYGTNYCNVFNLMDGSGLTQDPGYTETSSNSVCTQYSSADCDIY